ncbi:CpsD/CapB family tyrosine-protein kinase [Pokkaliibacter sp. CJK22405]|uniref:CpsD/CapB family tyrosine-protein kinase n=1 Tax=Pokkaliibacter sp. CJK22405 TaxID=3384615 RepID=UPI003984B60B
MSHVSPRPQQASEVNLVSLLEDPEQQVFLMTAPGPQTGTTTAARQLAEQLARSAMGRILLIDTSLSDQSLTREAGLAEAPGLIEALQQQAISSAVTSSHYVSFDVLPLGRRQFWQDGLYHRQLRPLLNELRSRYRFIIIDSDAVYTSADTLMLSALVDGVILVVAGENTRWEVAQATVQRLRQSGAKLLGTIFNRRKYYMPRWLYDQL